MRTVAEMVRYGFLLCVAVAVSGPLVAASRPITIDDLITLRKVGRLEIAPDGHSVAYLVTQAIVPRDAYSITLMVATVGGEARRAQLVKVETSAVRTPTSDVVENVGAEYTGDILFTWERDGKALVYGVRGHDKTDLFKYFPETQTTVALPSLSARPNTLLTLADGKLAFCLTVAAEAPQNPEILRDPAYRYDRATFHFWDKHPWQDARDLGADGAYVGSNGKSCFELDEASGRTAAISASAARRVDPLAPITIYTHEGKAALAATSYEGLPAQAAWASPDGKRTLFSVQVPSTESARGVDWERKYLFVVEHPDHRQTRIFELGSAHEGSIEMVLWAPDSKGVLALRRALDQTRLVRFDISTAKETTLYEGPWGIYHPAVSPNARYLYATCEKADVPKRLCRIDLLTGEMALVDDVNRQLNDVALPAHTEIRQFNRYGDELTGYLFVPPGFHGESRIPLVAIRGQDWGAFCDGGTGVEFPGMVMAMRGFAVLFFEPSTKHFPASQTGNNAFSELRFQSPLENLRLVIADLVHRGWVDPARTGLAGLSAGADIVNYAAGFSTVFAVGAATTGEVYSPANYFLFDEDQVVGFFSKRYTLPYPDIAGLPAWQRVSSSLNAASSRMPLLFQPGDGEAWMTVTQHIAWQHAELPVETYVYPDEGHVKTHPLNRSYVMTRNLQWFDFWLRGVEDSRPEFADQFRRWEKMRADWLARKSSASRSQ